MSHIVDNSNANTSVERNERPGLGEKASEVYTAIQQEAGAYIERGRQAVGDAKEKAAQIQQGAQKAMETAQQRTQEYVDTARRTTEPYVNGAKHAVETGKDQVEAVRAKIAHGAEQVNKFDVTKTRLFGSAVHFTSLIVYYCWYVISILPFVVSCLQLFMAKADKVGASNLALECTLYAVSILERVPFFGIRSADAMRAFYKDVRQASSSRIEAAASKKKIA